MLPDYTKAAIQPTNNNMFHKPENESFSSCTDFHASQSESFTGLNHQFNDLIRLAVPHIPPAAKTIWKTYNFKQTLL